jgi:TMEM151 family
MASNLNAPPQQIYAAPPADVNEQQITIQMNGPMAPQTQGTNLVEQPNSNQPQTIQMVQYNQPQQVIPPNPVVAPFQINHELLSSQDFKFAPVSVPEDIKQMTPEEMVKLQQKEVENFPVRKDCCYDRIFLSLMGTIGVILGVVLAYYFSKLIHIVTAAFGILFIVDFFTSNTFHFLRSKMISAKALQFLESLQKAYPRIIWEIQCYHYETRTRYVYTKNGGYTQTYTVRVNTHHARHDLKILRAADASNCDAIIQNLKLLALCRLYLVKEYGFDSVATEQNFYALKKHFIAVNKRDVHYDFSESFQIDGFLSRAVSHNGDNGGKVYSIPFYIFMTLFGFGWLLRLLFYKNSFCGNIRIKKIISL